MTEQPEYRPADATATARLAAVEPQAAPLWAAAEQADVRPAQAMTTARLAAVEPQAAPLWAAAEQADVRPAQAMTAATIPAARAVPASSAAVAGTTPALAVSGRSVESGGGAGAGFVVIPEQYRAAAGPVLGVADQLAELTTSLGAYMTGMHGNAPWGNDDSGKSFANGEDGEPGYLDNARDILESLKALPGIVETVGNRLKGMADGYENAEESSLSGFGDYDPALPAPTSGPLGSVYRDIVSGNTTHPGRH
ncbi:hypothetical protein [Kitasatospora camelliae]|uniref:Type VII secretion system (Wss) protein ESAT-6 n=1 Tax=Kitasatospora camelliae TaxID=3156397 RepID=A0AAU8JPJ1_9ACTN